MSSVNRVILVGNLGENPKVNHTAEGGHVANFSLATSETWKDKGGERQEKTSWHRIVVWGRQAEIAGEYLAKGSQVYIEGRLDYRKYTDKDGVEKYSTDIVADRMQIIKGKPREGEASGNGQQRNSEAPARRQHPGRR